MVFSTTAALEFHLGIFNRYPPSLRQGQRSGGRPLTLSNLLGPGWDQLSGNGGGPTLDDEVTASKTAITGLQLREITLSSGNTPLLCDVSTGAERPLVPVRWRRRVFDAIHGLSHPSIRSTCKLIAAKFVWHGLAKQVRDWAKACIPCQRSKIHRHTKTPLPCQDSRTAKSI